MASPFSVGARSAERKHVMFMWNGSSGLRLWLREGLYNIRFMFFTSESSRPIINTDQSFVVSEESANQLEKYRTQKEPKHVEFILNQEIKSGRVLTAAELKKLLS